MVMNLLAGVSLVAVAVSVTCLLNLGFVSFRLVSFFSFLFFFFLLFSSLSLGGPIQILGVVEAPPGTPDGDVYVPDGRLRFPRSYAGGRHRN